MNSFQLDYKTRLKEWVELREKIKDQDLETQCIAVDRFWQQCPLYNHYLHPVDIKDWPDPWELIHDNNFCVYGRGLGMVYTLMMIGIDEVDFVDAIDHHANDVVLVIVKNTYILNYWPDTVKTNRISNFTVKFPISIDILRKKLK